ncbi:MAG: LPS assembly protein LptD [Arenicellales bacterium]|nr:LPS assembly protein LptD [Arenicellales bacterium]
MTVRADEWYPWRGALAWLFGAVLSSLGLYPAGLSAEPPLSFASATTCPPDIISIPDELLPYVSKDASGQPINLEADQIDLPEKDVLILTGAAVVTQGAQGIYAERIQVDREAMSLQAEQTVVLHSISGDRITADFLTLDIETRIGLARNVTFQVAQREPLPKPKVAAPDTVGSTPDVIRLPTGEVIPVVKPPIGTKAISAGGGPAPADEPRQIKAQARGSAEQVFLEGHDRERLQNAVYSRCVAGDDSVLLEAREIILDHATGIGTGKHMKVRFLGAPIAYFPWVSFPIDDERKTGFLFPSLGYGESQGFNFHLPYYWNIAPERDATFTGYYMAARGLQAVGEYRYMGETAGGNYAGRLRGELMPHDSKFGDSRYGWSYEYQQSMRRWDTDFDISADVGYVSDTAYLDDLSDSLEVSSAAHVPQTMTLAADPFDIFLEGENLALQADLSAYQTVDANVDKASEPYSRLPGIVVTWDRTFGLSLQDASGYLRDDSTRFTLRPEVDSELVNFGHSSSDKTKGMRLDIQPAMSLSMERTYGSVTPKLTYAYTGYNVTGQPAGKPSSPTRSIYLLEVASELFLEREVSWQSVDYVQTLVPRLSYHYVPYKNQDDLPVFDTGSVGFNNIADAFLGDGYWGSDRIQDFQGFTLGLESETYRAKTGERLMKWSLAQQVYLADRQVSLDSDDEPQTSSLSPLLGEIEFQVRRDWSTNGFISWNWDASEVENWRASARYSPDFRRAAGVSYQSEEAGNNLELDLSWPLGARWQLGAAALISQMENEDGGEYTRVSLGYDACCWAVQAALEDRPRQNDDDGAGTQFMLTLQLKGLGTISTGDFSSGFTVGAAGIN